MFLIASIENILLYHICNIRLSFEYLVTLSKRHFELLQTNNMNITSLFRGISLFLIIIFSTQFNLNAQLRINSGYDLSFTTTNKANEILDNYNLANPDAISPFTSFGLSNGLLLGVRYEIEFIGVEATWIYRFDDEEAIISEIDGTINSIKLLGRFQTFSFGIDNQFDWFSYGGSIDFNITNIKARRNDQDNNTSFLRENNYEATFYIGFNTSRSNQIRLSLRPFVKIPLTSIDFNDLDIKLNESSTVNNSKGRPLAFGLRIIFTNG